MNICLKYEDSSYKFDIQNNKNIDYLKELTSKIFKNRKECFELIYGDQILTNLPPKQIIKSVLKTNVKEHEIQVKLVETDKDVPKIDDKLYFETVRQLENIKSEITDYDEKILKTNHNIKKFKENVDEIIDKLLDKLTLLKKNIISIDNYLYNESEIKNFTNLKDEVKSLKIKFVDDNCLAKIHRYKNKLDNFEDYFKCINKREKFEDFIYDLLNEKFSLVTDYSNKINDLINTYDSNIKDFQEQVDLFLTKDNKKQEESIIKKKQSVQNKKELPIISNKSIQNTHSPKVQLKVINDDYDINDYEIVNKSSKNIFQKRTSFMFTNISTNILIKAKEMMNNQINKKIETINRDNNIRKTMIKNNQSCFHVKNNSEIPMNQRKSIFFLNKRPNLNLNNNSINSIFNTKGNIKTGKYKSKNNLNVITESNLEKVINENNESIGNNKDDQNNQGNQDNQDNKDNQDNPMIECKKNSNKEPINFTDFTNKFNNNLKISNIKKKLILKSIDLTSSDNNTNINNNEISKTIPNNILSKLSLNKKKDNSTIDQIKLSSHNTPKKRKSIRSPPNRKESKKICLTKDNEKKNKNKIIRDNLVYELEPQPIEEINNSFLKSYYSNNNNNNNNNSRNINEENKDSFYSAVNTNTNSINNKSNSHSKGIRKSNLKERNDYNNEGDGDNSKDDKVINFVRKEREPFKSIRIDNFSKKSTMSKASENGKKKYQKDKEYDFII